MNYVVEDATARTTRHNANTRYDANSVKAIQILQAKI